MQTITRPFEFDAAHRVMNQKFKCHNLHGHRYRAELTFQFNEMQDIGYEMDFAEIKRIAGAWIDDYLDHGFIANPADADLINICHNSGWKLYLMHLDENYCNPTAENIAQELFCAISFLMNSPTFMLQSVKLYETPNCWTVVTEPNPHFSQAFQVAMTDSLVSYKKSKGTIQYDDRK